MPRLHGTTESSSVSVRGAAEPGIGGPYRALRILTLVTSYPRDS